MSVTQVFSGDFAVTKQTDFQKQLQLGHSLASEFAFIQAFRQDTVAFTDLRINSSTDGSGNILLGGNTVIGKVTYSGTGTSESNAQGVGLDTASVQTTDATETTCGSFLTSDDQGYAVECTFHCIKTDNTKVGMFKRMAVFRNNGGTLTQASTAQTIGTDLDSDDTNLDVDIDSSGTTIRMRVIGIAAETWEWQTDFKISVIVS